MRTLRRREFLAGSALLAGGTFLTSHVAFARTSEQGRPRVVFVIMRGALDGLAVVPPYGDENYAALRGDLAIAAPGSMTGALALDGFFGLHPSLSFMHEAYAARELLIVHAAATPYRARSHFDGQDLLESGALRPHAEATGWLNRALISLRSGRGSGELGVAVGQNVPLLMRGPAAVTSWSPSRLASLDDDTLQRVSDLYAGDPLLASRLAAAMAADSMAAESMAKESMAALATAAESMAAHSPAVSDDTVSRFQSDQKPAPALQRTRYPRYTEIVRASAEFLRREDGPQVAVFDTTGWDTHANEVNASGQLAVRLGALDEGLRTLKSELGPVWKDTVVMLVTEFGRTVATNGTRGTDHGTATAAFMLGGAVQGGYVKTDWPGLAAGSLYEGRDLRPTTDLRSVIKGMLLEHLGVPASALEDKVFPQSGAARPIRGLIRS